MNIQNDLRIQVGENLKLARELAGLSQAQAAKLMEMHRPTVTEIEKGRRRVSAEELVAFANVYHVTVEWLTQPQKGIDTDLGSDARIAARALAKLDRTDYEKVLRVIQATRGKK